MALRVETFDLTRLCGRVARPSWQLLRWRLSRWVTPSGAMTALGLLLGFSAAIVYWLEIPQLRDRAAELQSKIDAAQVAVVERDEKPALISQLESYYEQFPPLSDRAKILGRIFEIAARQKVQLIQGAYVLKGARGERLSRYDVTFPIKGSYTQIRSFALHVTRDVPNIALESMSFQRKTASDDSVQAQIKFVVMMRAEIQK